MDDTEKLALYEAIPYNKSLAEYRIYNDLILKPYCKLFEQSFLQDKRTNVIALILKEIGDTRQASELTDEEGDKLLSDNLQLTDDYRMSIFSQDTATMINKETVYRALQRINLALELELTKLTKHNE